MAKVLEKDFQCQTDFKKIFTFQETCLIHKVLVETNIPNEIIDKYDEFISLTYGWVIMHDYKFNKNGEPMEEVIYGSFKNVRSSIQNYNKIRLFEAFSGIGSQAKALKRLQQKLNFDLELIGFSEIDKFAIKSYKAIHGDIKNFGDIKNIKGLDLPEIDLFTYSFPCQDISNVGKKSGFEKGSNTRSGLLWEVERILNELKNNNKLPKVLLMENVKALVNKKFFINFQEWLNELNKLGYNNYWKVINAKDHNIPQNRERIFMISILGDNNYIFPQKENLNNNLINVLENMPRDKFFFFFFFY